MPSGCWSSAARRTSWPTSPKLVDGSVGRRDRPERRRRSMRSGRCTGWACSTAIGRRRRHGRRRREGGSSIRRPACAATRSWPCRGSRHRGGLVAQRRCSNDPDPQVRLAACLALAELPAEATATAPSRIVSAVLDPRNQQDRWMADALTIAAAAHARPSSSKRPAQSRTGGSDGRLADPVIARSPSTTRGAGRSTRSASILAAPGRHEAGGARGHHRRPREGLAAGTRRRSSTPTPRRPSPRSCRSSRPTPAARCSGSPRAGASRGSTPFVAELARDFLAAAADEAKPDAARIDAARQLIDLRKADPQAARDVIALVTAKTPPELASGLIGAVARSDSPEVGPALVDAIGPMTPAARKAERPGAARQDGLDGRARRAGSRAGKVPLSLLSLDQSQALAAHPDRTIAERAKALLAKGGGLPDPDREKVIQALAPLVLKGGDAVARQGDLQEGMRQVPHALGRGGQGRPRPHRHGRASRRAS